MQAALAANLAQPPERKAPQQLFAQRIDRHPCRRSVGIFSAVIVFKCIAGRDPCDRFTHVQQRLFIDACGVDVKQSTDPRQQLLFIPQLDHQRWGQRRVGHAQVDAAHRDRVMFDFKDFLQRWIETVILPYRDLGYDAVVCNEREGPVSICTQLFVFDPAMLTPPEWLAPDQPRID